MVDGLGEPAGTPFGCKVLLAQRSPVPGDPARNAADAAEVLAEYPDVDLAVFPELFLCGYDVTRVHGYGLGLDTEPLGVLRRACAASGTALVAGFAERNEAGGPPYNAMLCADRDGTFVDVYRKTHLYGAERTAFTAGDRLACVSLAGIRIAPMVCFDLEIPEVARRSPANAPTCWWPSPPTWTRTPTTTRSPPAPAPWRTAHR